jgi:sugar lactone lactonase YvrE
MSGTRLTTQRALVSAVALAIAMGAPSAWCNSASLWIADSFHNRVVELTPKTLKHTGMPAPTVLEGPDFTDVQGVAFDKSKNIWVTTHTTAVVEFSPSELKKLGSNSAPVPATTIISPMFGFLGGCSFDAGGNLWIADIDDDGVHELSKQQLKAGNNSSITPAVTITSLATLDEPDFLAFDRSGNLWISSHTNSEIVEFEVSQLGSSGDKMPAIVLSDNSGSIDVPAQIAFDHDGNLWVANLNSISVVMFAKSALAASGNPTPAVTLNGSAFTGPWGLAFDRGNNLWISDLINGKVSKFSVKQLKHSGTPTPPVVLSGFLFGSNQLTFGPVF